MAEHDVLYCFQNPSGQYVRFEEGSPYMPVVPVYPRLSEPGRIQCFLSASDADYRKNEMRDRFLAYADSFDELVLTWVTDALLSDERYVVDIVRY